MQTTSLCSPVHAWNELTASGAVCTSSNKLLMPTKGRQIQKIRKPKSGRKGIWLCLAIGLWKSVCTTDTVVQHLLSKATWNHSRTQVERRGFFSNLSICSLPSFMQENCEQTPFLLHPKFLLSLWDSPPPTFSRRKEMSQKKWYS